MLQVHEAVNLTASRHVKVISLSHQIINILFSSLIITTGEEEKDKNETSPSIDPSSLACHLTRPDLVGGRRRLLSPQCILASQQLS